MTANIVLNAETSVHIHAHKNLCWSELSALQFYPGWNSRTHFHCKAVVGKRLTMTVKLFSFWLKVPVTIEHVDADRGLRWTGGLRGLFTGSHYFSLQCHGDGTTTLVQGEDFDGVLVRFLWPILHKELKGLYQGFNQEFKQRCETNNNGLINTPSVPDTPYR